MTRENKLALVLGFGLMLFVGILVSDHLAARHAPPIATDQIARHEPGVPPLPPPGTRDAIVALDHSGSGRVIGTQPPESAADPAADDGWPADDSVAPGPIGTSPEVAVTSLPERAPLPPVRSIRTYQVREGDTFAAIAEREYGRRALGERLASFNDMKPERLRIGATVRLPAIGELDPSVAASGSISPEPAVASRGDDQRTYVVRDGDTLYRIAEREMGAAQRWKELEAANPHVSGRTLQPGMELRIPVRLTASVSPRGS